MISFIMYQASKGNEMYAAKYVLSEIGQGDLEEAKDLILKALPETDPAGRLRVWMATCRLSRDTKASKVWPPRVYTDTVKARMNSYRAHLRYGGPLVLTSLEDVLKQQLDMSQRWSRNHILVENGTTLFQRQPYTMGRAEILRLDKRITELMNDV